MSRKRCPNIIDLDQDISTKFVVSFLTEKIFHMKTIISNLNSRKTLDNDHNFGQQWLLFFGVQWFFAINILRHFWPQILKLRIKSQFFDWKCIFWQILAMCITKFADKKVRESQGPLFSEKNLKKVFFWENCIEYYCMIQQIFQVPRYVSRRI